MAPLKLLITQSALQAIDLFLTTRNKLKILRIGVRGGGGCSGFKYNIECAEHFSPSKDFYFIYDDIYIIVDKKSMPIINGSVLYWIKSSTEQGLKFSNPNVKSTCKCGKSFSI